MRFRNTFLLLFIIAFGLPFRPFSADADVQPYFTEPSLAPDRSEIAFVSGGDIWTVPLQGGEAHLLVSHEAVESRPLYSPDGSRLAFTSTRSGNGDIYLLTLATGDLIRLTYDDGNDQLNGWSRDGKWLYFHSTSRDVLGMNDIYRISVEGGTPMLVSADRYVNEYFAAPAPDGNTLAITARGIASGQWWRRGHSHIDECEVWLLKEGKNYQRLTARGAKHMWPMWSSDGQTVYYMSDEGGNENIWAHPVNGPARQLTKFTNGRVLWPSISYDGKTILFERNCQLWKLDLASEQASELKITRRGASATPGVEFLRLSNQINELALSPDGKKIAFIVRGELFAAAAKEGGTAFRVTRTPAAEYHVSWSPDSRNLVYASNRDQHGDLYLYDFVTNSESRLTSDSGDDAEPRYSPDGKLIAFIRDGKELRVLDRVTNKDRVIATNYLDKPPLSSERSYVWSPDSRWIAYVSGNLFANINVVPVAGGDSKQISYLANVFSNSISWAPDGKFLLFDTGQRTESRQLARVDLIPRTPKFREDLFKDLFKDEKSVSQTATPAPTNVPAGAPTADTAISRAVEISFDRIRQRLSLVPVGIDVFYHSISPDGKSVLMSAGAAGQANLYVYSIDEFSREPAVARQLTSTAGFKGDAQFSPDGKEVYYLERGTINVVTVENRQMRTISVVAEMEVDFSKEKMVVFDQAWSYLRDFFYDPNYHGVNWQALRAEYQPRVAGARTPEEMRRIIALMIGELNASHLGIDGPGNPAQITGKLGVNFDREEYERNGLFKISEVIPLSPADLSGAVRAGDYLLAIDGIKTGARVNVDELLNNKVGQRVMLTVAANGEGLNKREVALLPVNLFTEKGLIYKKIVEERRDYVHRISNGRIGYAHMINMSEAALSQFYIDLDTENRARDGVVIDIRNNNGGFVNVYAIDVLARRSYLNMSFRLGAPNAPARTMLGQRALELPTILVTNQHSLSDAEDFTEGYRALKLGKIVGEPTAGWIIFTSNVSLIDGSTLRLPHTKITATDGTNMELNPRPVDLPVVRPIGEGLTGRDTQLDVAVQELLKQLGKS